MSTDRVEAEMITDDELADQDELDVSNLLVTKSERAPASEVSPPLEPPIEAPATKNAELFKTAAIGAIGSLLLLLFLRLIFPPTRH